MWLQMKMKQKLSSQIITALLLGSIFYLSGCSAFIRGVEKIADPYDKKFKCPHAEGYDCLDLEQSYLKDQEQNGTSNEPKEWAGAATELTITTPEHSVYSETISIYDGPAIENIGEAEVQISEDAEKDILKIVTDHTSRSTADMLIEYIAAKQLFPELEGNVLRAVAQTYENCIRAAQKENKKKRKQARKKGKEFSDAEAIKNLRQCTGYLRNVPGMVAFKSNSLSERLRIQRETETRKYISSTVHSGNLPIRIPAKTIQIRVCSYTDDTGMLLKDHHVFTTVGEGRWVHDRGEKISGYGTLKPLE